MPGLRVHTPDLVPAWQDVDKIPVVHSRTSGHHDQALQLSFVSQLDTYSSLTVAPV